MTSVSISQRETEELVDQINQYRPEQGYEDPEALMCMLETPAFRHRWV